MAKIKKYAARGISLDGVDEATRRVKFTFMTEAPCDNWFVPESCICEKECVDLTRFDNGVMPVLFNHNRDMVIGKVDKIALEDHRAIAEIVLDDDEESNKIMKKLLSGSLKGVSVGYCRLHTVRVKAGDEYRGVKYEEVTDVTDLWQPYEVSIVSCPADPDCGVGRELKEIEMEIKESEEKSMELYHGDIIFLTFTGCPTVNRVILKRLSCPEWDVGEVLSYSLKLLSMLQFLFARLTLIDKYFGTKTKSTFFTF